MARPSKSKHFAIYEDSGIPTPDSSHQPSFDDVLRARQQSLDDDDVFAEDERDGEGSVLDDIEEAEETNNREPSDTEEEDERRESAITSTSISSLPDSSTDTDNERSRPMHKPYTPPMIRPSFRRPESVRRMQMSSPVPFERSPRRSALLSQSRSGTPRSSRSSVKGSPRPRRQQEEESVELEMKEYPLVLLHVSLLPVELRWGMDVMQEVLPQRILDNLQLLRSKVTETILQRGILIPHPREEYELLEERLLEALELRKERVTKCGHFRARESTSSVSSEEGSMQSDSGVGSSIGSDDELCTTCRHHLKTARTVTGTGGSRWNIRVFAANGLMRASAWAAAWSEMERVDVEIQPWIGEDLRRQLDARAEQEDVDKTLDVEMPERMPEASMLDHDTFALPPPAPLEVPPEPHESRESGNELPQVYRAKDVPLSLLLKNYIYLLAKDRRNVVIFGLAALAMWLSLRAALLPSTVEISALPPMCETRRPELVELDASDASEKLEVQLAVDVNASQAMSTPFEEALSTPEYPPVQLESFEVALNSLEGGLPSEENPVVEALKEAEKPMLEAVVDDHLPQSVLEACDNPASTVHLFEAPVLVTSPADA